MPWVKGQSGNKSGRPKVFADVQALARSYTKENLARIAHLAEFAEDDNVKLRASVSLHEIAWGKPSQQQIITGPDNSPVQVQWIM